MKIPTSRDDLSRFLVHLTRDYDGTLARNNLISILKDKTIEARNSHCLVMHKLKQLGFSKLLKEKFRTTCFTETPLTQLNQLTQDTEDRNIKLQPYGIVFWKEELFDEGASPAIYINAKGTSISQFLLNEFDSIFKNTRTFKGLREQEKVHYTSIIHYYSLINVVKDKHDFLWEREWRHHGNFNFEYNEIVAIIAKNPSGFEKLCERKLPKKQYEFIKKTPIINPEWTYEELLENLTIQIWHKLS